MDGVKSSDGGAGSGGGGGGGGGSNLLGGTGRLSGVRGGGGGGGGPSVGNLSISSEMEETLRRIKDSRNVMGLVLVNAEGLPVTSSLDSTLTVQYSDLITSLVSTARSVVRALDPANRLEYFRVRSRKHEILIAPDRDYTLFIIQNPAAENGGANWENGK